LRLHPSFRDKRHKAFTLTEPHSSNFDADIIFELLSIGLRPEEEFLTKTGYRLNALVEVKGTKVGIEVDGPSHFVGRKANGSTILSRQVSTLDKILAVSVPYWECDKLDMDRGKKQEYLRNLLSFG
jgi:hypothetical protein